ncbi:hypothetical protein [Streptomyces sp. NBC_01483]|uniref:hypothetical protein n=1 Tax=Streptomyces sp. NBC_01483 TaxID=2903883 RepID=UPI002E354FB0|nr:hypothetical protein [Streptomyces sp. NBC_01483]
MAEHVDAYPPVPAVRTPQLRGRGRRSEAAAPVRRLALVLVVLAHDSIVLRTSGPRQG